MLLKIREYDLAMGQRRQRVKVLENEDLPIKVRAELARRGGYITRNSTCPCGSGRKFKRCCGRKYEYVPSVSLMGGAS